MPHGMRCEQRWIALMWLGVGMPNLAGETKFYNECHGGNRSTSFLFCFWKMHLKGLVGTQVGGWVNWVSNLKPKIFVSK
jgi:hypothetical protein